MAEIVATQTYVDGTGQKVILYNHATAAYPTRPVGISPGLVTYQGPTEPTDWLERDLWVETVLTVGSGTLSWAPPTLVSPLDIYLSATDGGRKAMMDPTKDYRVHLPSTPLDVAYGIELNGGRNVVLIGGEIHFAADFGGDNSNRALFIKGNAAQTVARTVHVEGVKFSGVLTEGINVDSQSEPGLTIRLQNINCVDPLLGSQATNHSDFVQVYNGPKILDLDRIYARCNYQFAMIQPKAFGTGPVTTYTFRRVFADGPNGAGLFYKVTGDGSPTIVIDQVYANHNPSKSFPSQVLLESAGLWSGVQAGSPPASFLSGTPGTAYVSPGYGSSPPPDPPPDDDWPVPSGWVEVETELFDSGLDNWTIVDSATQHPAGDNVDVRWREAQVSTVNVGGTWELQIAGQRSGSLLNGGGMYWDELASTRRSTTTRVECRVKFDTSPGWKGVGMLWPTQDENWPANGELDMWEFGGGSRAGSDMNIHYGSIGDGGAQDQYTTPSNIDMSQWHDTAWEWGTVAGQEYNMFEVDGVIRCDSRTGVGKTYWQAGSHATPVPNADIVPMIVTFQLDVDPGFPTGSMPTTPCIMHIQRVRILAPG